MSLTGKSALTTAAIFDNDGFWHDLSIADLLSRYRVPSEIPDDVVPIALQMAVIRVNEQLDAVKAAIILLGYASLQAYIDANSQPLNGGEQLVKSYEHAVYSRAKAALIPQFVNAIRLSKGDDKTQSNAEESERYWLDESQSMIAAFHRQFFPDDDLKPGNANVHVALL